MIRFLRDFDAAEEAIQEAFAVALVRWPVDEVPQNPAAWITTTAYRKVIDSARRDQVRDQKYLIIATSQSEDDQFTMLDSMDDSQLRDDWLRLVFTCCHPALNMESRVTLALRTLGGLSITEISQAFLVPEPPMAQRLVRAKRKIKDAGICFMVGHNMAVGVTDADLMVRPGPLNFEAVLALPYARPIDFTGRPMKGFVYVEPEGITTDTALAALVERGTAFACSLPAK